MLYQIVVYTAFKEGKQRDKIKARERVTMTITWSLDLVIYLLETGTAIW